MKRLFIITLIMALVSGFFATTTEAEPIPEPQRHGSSSRSMQVDAYYYDYVNQKIAHLPIRIYRRKIFEYCNQDTWISCSVRAKTNKKGDTSDDVPEDWKKMSEDFEYTAEINHIKIFFDIDETGYY